MIEEPFIGCSTEVDALDEAKGRTDQRPTHAPRFCLNREDREMKKCEAMLSALFLSLASPTLAFAGSGVEDQIDDLQDTIEEFDDTRKKLTECGTIDMPGSYRLGNNLSAEAPTLVCLLVNADFVTIDLQGFAIRRTVNRQLPGTGISGGGRSGITIRNGMIVGLRDGIILTGSFNSRVENMSVIDHGSGGVTVTTTAIDAGAVAHVSDNIVAQPGGTATMATGITVVCPAIVISNVVDIGAPQTAYFDDSGT